MQPLSLRLLSLCQTKLLLHRIFWHGRMAHSVGQHRGSKVRIGVPCDFQQDRPLLQPEHHAALGQWEWWTPTRIFADDRPASEGLWKGWAIEEA